jgi:hypothetical protein
MRGKTIAWIIGIFVLIYIAGVPLGQMIAAIGGGLITLGNDIAAIGLKFHGG